MSALFQRKATSSAFTFSFNCVLITTILPKLSRGTTSSSSTSFPYYNCYLSKLYSNYKAIIAISHTPCSLVHLSRGFLKGYVIAISGRPLIAPNFADSIFGGELHFKVRCRSYGSKLVENRSFDNGVVC
jgi:hypothetical protein